MNFYEHAANKLNKQQMTLGEILCTALLSTTFQILLAIEIY